ncbi:MAG: single-stranded DNA-binding protein, partial [Candidatus Saccharibacteria bacterium]|jgi:single-strand DNA-binding protein|nr:single-stranded DNA-binding protein [Patescibacteria group bacterium]MCA9336171.1 single-stranded DNA-binding protein [Candidatus Saccharibacteria bacterium]MCA9339315.1 single-stranded DNA-binding protein [Candidatus Saccharibacteria bacterium]
MAKGFNKVILMGNLTRDVETRTTPSGQTVSNFSLAVSRSWKGQDGQTQEQTSFINCVAWGKVGEIIAQYTSKGTPLLVSGRLDQRSYEDKDGNKRQAVEVVVEDFNFIGGGRGDDNGSSAPRSSSASSKSKDVVIEDIDDKPIDLSEIPF